MKRLFKVIFLIIAAFPPTVFSGVVNDRDMKAALIYNFSVFTSWPDHKADVFNICTFAEDQDNINQEILQSKKINEKVVRLSVIHNKADIQKCHVLYIQESRMIDDPRVLEMLNTLPVLSIVDTTERDPKAGVINIQLEDNRYYFSVNNEAAKRASLNLSSRLLRLATKVY